MSDKDTFQPPLQAETEPASSLCATCGMASGFHWIGWKPSDGCWPLKNPFSREPASPQPAQPEGNGLELALMQATNLLVRHKDEGGLDCPNTEQNCGYCTSCQLNLWLHYRNAAKSSVIAPIQSEILPCPCCGGVSNFGNDGDGGEFIECSKCHLTTNLQYALKEDAKPHLVERWNRRSAVAQPAQKQGAELLESVAVFIEGCYAGLEPNIVHIANRDYYLSVVRGLIRWNASRSEPKAQKRAEGEFDWGSRCVECGLLMAGGQLRHCEHGGFCSWRVPPALRIELRSALQKISEYEELLKEANSELAKSTEAMGRIAALSPAPEAKLLDAINWAMGCGEDGFEKPDGCPAYWWRTELAKRAGLQYDPDSQAYRQREKEKTGESIA